MAGYTAPLRDMQFVLEELADFDAVAALPAFGGTNAELAQAVLEAAGKFAAEVLAPLNKSGDREGSRLANGAVTTPKGFKDAYSRFVADGWNGIASSPEHGGQGVPRLVSAAVQEMWHGSNMAFALCPMLTQGAVEALLLCGSDALKRAYLPKLVSGEWTGTMNLTEPQAGSDLAAVRCRAVPEGDHYRISGQKIFITYGDHDYTDNIIHMVLARTPTAPAGVKGISMFLVPKVLVNADGTLGKRNDVQCASLEHKLGIHGSPTAVLAYGDKGGAIGYLVGEENKGLAYMFIMMNLARFAVGVQGLGMAERALQQAAQYARERVQGTGPDGKPLTIVHHPDVRRMLMSIKARTEAMRAVSYLTAARLDIAADGADAAARARAQAFVDLMIPVVKGWCTESAVDISSLCVQVYGGMGFIEESEAPQTYRDVRISTIYEGTTGIQAKDLLGRKIIRDQGAAARAFLAEMRALDADLAKAGGEDMKVIRARLFAAIDAFDHAVSWVLQNHERSPDAVAAGAVPLLMLLGTVAGGWQLARAALAAQRRLAGGRDAFLEAKLVTARYYADHELVKAPVLAEEITAGAAGILGLPESAFQ